MKMTDAFNSKAIAAVFTETASNKIAYLGAGLFPAKKKAGLDLKWIKGSKGLPVSLAPSAFDTVSTIRSRQGIAITDTEMAFFKESMLLKEQDEQDIMRVQDSADPFAKEVIDRIYNDAVTLVEGAEVVPERMRMQLISSAHYESSQSKAVGPSISIAANGATYAYNYDADGSYASNNFMRLTENNVWSDTVNSDPMNDVMQAQDAVEEATGSRPEIMIISKQTMEYLKKNANVRSYILAQNTTANVIITDARVKAIFSEELGVSIIVYTKKYKDENGTVQSFFPDGKAALIPSGALGSTWFGMTPDERTGVNDKSKDVTIVNTGVAVAVKITDDPVQTKTTVSEIVLPSFERMDETFQIECY